MSLQQCLLQTHRYSIDKISTAQRVWAGSEGRGQGAGEEVIKEEVIGRSTGQKCQGPQCRRCRELAKSSSGIECECRQCV